MNDQLRQELLQLHKLDLDTREILSKSGELYEGYHPQMEEIHKDNAERLEKIVEEYGWPGKTLVGEDGAEAAWIIFQHNIGNPKMFRRFLPKLKIAAEKGDIDKILLAKTIDRICMYEGRPQIYGTNYDWDENGELSPWPIQNPDNVDKLRKEIGLPPMDEYTQTMRQQARSRNEKPPKNYSQYRKEMENWCYKVGWRKQVLT